MEEIKGGWVACRPVYIYVTSNYTIDQVFKHCSDTDRAALHRRFKEVFYTEEMRYPKVVLTQDKTARMYSPMSAGNLMKLREAIVLSVTEEHIPPLYTYSHCRVAVNMLFGDGAVDSLNVKGGEYDEAFFKPSAQGFTIR